MCICFTMHEKWMQFRKLLLNFVGKKRNIYVKLKAERKHHFFVTILKVKKEKRKKRSFASFHAKNNSRIWKTKQIIISLLSSLILLTSLNSADVWCVFAFFTLCSLFAAFFLFRYFCTYKILLFIVGEPYIISWNKIFFFLLSYSNFFFFSKMENFWNITNFSCLFVSVFIL